MNFGLMVFLAAVGTYATRLLPMLAGQRLLDSVRSPWITGFLGALGITAIVALIIVSMQDLYVARPERQTLLAMCCGGVVVIVGMKTFRNVGVATLIGAVVYGGIQVL